MNEAIARHEREIIIIGCNHYEISWRGGGGLDGYGIRIFYCLACGKVIADDFVNIAEQEKLPRDHYKQKIVYSKSLRRFVCSNCNKVVLARKRFQ